MRGDVRLQHVQGFLEALFGLAGGDGTEAELAGDESRGCLSVGDGGAGVVADGEAESVKGAVDEAAGAGATAGGGEVPRGRGGNAMRRWYFSNPKLLSLFKMFAERGERQQ
jgi:hypothetical protein